MDKCPICWGVPLDARRLPCSHCFCLGCLKSLPTAHTQCPLCRANLPPAAQFDLLPAVVTAAELPCSFCEEVSGSYCTGCKVFCCEACRRGHKRGSRHTFTTPQEGWVLLERESARQTLQPGLLQLNDRCKELEAAQQQADQIYVGYMTETHILMERNQALIRDLKLQLHNLEKNLELERQFHKKRLEGKSRQIKDNRAKLLETQRRIETLLRIGTIDDLAHQVGPCATSMEELLHSTSYSGGVPVMQAWHTSLRNLEKSLELCRKTEFTPIPLQPPQSYGERLTPDLGPHLTILPRPAANPQPFALSVACMPGNQLLICDTELSRLLVYSSEGELVNRLSKAGVRPRVVAMDLAHKELVVADARNHEIKIFGFDGYLLRSFGALLHLETPEAVLVDLAMQRYIVADTGNNRILFLDAAGRLLEELSSQDDSLHEPAGLGLLSSGELVVSSKRGFLTVWSAGKTLVRTISSPQGSSLGRLVVDQHDRILVLDTALCQVLVYASHTGELLESLASPACVGRPVGLAVDAAGKFWISGTTPMIACF